MELNPQAIAFFIFSVLTLGGGLGVVLNRNLVHGAAYLTVSLFGVAGLFVLLSAPFLAAVQILVYIGAIAILIIFAVMLTRSMTNLTEVYNRQWGLSLIVSVLFFGLLVVGIILPVWGPNTANAATIPAEFVANTRDFGMALVSGDHYVLPFEVASLLLTGAMIGAIVIARDND
jgi:NADH-quinone oxidoreductase subunit J